MRPAHFILAAVLLPVSTLFAQQAATRPSSPTPSAIKFLERRTADDPDDFTAWNRLGSLYLQRLRETGSLDYLHLAARAADKSLATIPARSNPVGVLLRARALFAAHEFEAARDAAKGLVDTDPDKVAYVMTYADALLELGDYPAAEAAFSRVAELAPDELETESRLARLAALKGDLDGAVGHMKAALAIAEASPNTLPETVAWCHWQLGDLAFTAGDYAAAESHNRKALDTFPAYYRARGGLARALAAQGKTADAIAAYEKAIESVPDPAFVAALHDLYLATGRKQEAAAQADLMESLAKLSAASGALYNRQVALFNATHDRKVEEAYAMAVKEYEHRKDVYGADAVAWTALKAGKPKEALAAAKEALKLGTKDPLLLYHAALVHQANNDPATAASLLKSALAQSPNFDPLQAPKASDVLRSLAK